MDDFESFAASLEDETYHRTRMEEDFSLPKNPQERLVYRLEEALTANQAYQKKMLQLRASIEQKLDSNTSQLTILKQLFNTSRRNKDSTYTYEFSHYEEPGKIPESYKILLMNHSSKKKAKLTGSLLKNILYDSSSDSYGDDDDDDENSDSGEEEEKQQSQFSDDDEDIMDSDEGITTKKEDLNKRTMNTPTRRKPKKAEDSDSKEKKVVKTMLKEYSGQNPRAINWIEVARTLNTKFKTVPRPAIFYYSVFMEDFFAKRQKEWTSEDDRRLCQAVYYYGTSSCKQIASVVETKNAYQCYQRWFKKINPNIRKGKWSLEEDISLVLGVEAYGNKNWIKISSLVTNRTDVQCRERYCNILDPTLNSLPWDPEEDKLLLKLYRQFGPKWSQIASQIKNRTDNQCWRRYKKLMSESQNTRKIFKIIRKPRISIKQEEVGEESSSPASQQLSAATSQLRRENFPSPRPEKKMKND